MCAPAAPGWPNPRASAAVLGPARRRSGRVRGGMGVTAGRVGDGPVGRARRVVTVPGGASGVFPGRIITPDQGQSGHRVEQRDGGPARGGRGASPRARFAGQTPGHTRGRRSGRGARARAGPASGRVVTQKHRHSTLRSTSGGCLRVTRREDCGRVPSKRRCLGVRIMPIVGRHALRLRILTPHETGGPRVSIAREPSPRGMGYVGLARRTAGLATGPWPAAPRPRPSSHVLRPRRPGGGRTAWVETSPHAMRLHRTG